MLGIQIQVLVLQLACSLRMVQSERGEDWGRVREGK